jgi:chromosome segregation ATPase
MASKARDYAEKELGVHEVYKTAQDANGEMIDLQVKLVEVRDQRRRMTEEMADREVDIWRDLRGQHPELSATALDAKAKHERRVDQTMQELRRGLLDTQKQEDKLEQDIKAKQNRINSANARMIELGGYLPYLTMVWQQDAVAQQNTP